MGNQVGNQNRDGWLGAAGNIHTPIRRANTTLQTVDIVDAGLVRSSNTAKLQFTDRDGDFVAFVVSDGKLLEYVNDKFIRVVTKITWRWKDWSIWDQEQWGGKPKLEECFKILKKLLSMCRACGVENNIPRPITSQRAAVTRFTFDLSQVRSHKIRGLVRQAVKILMVDVPALVFEEQSPGGHLVISDEQDGCWSHVGFQEVNKMNLDPSWNEWAGPPLGSVLHEFLHFLGLTHEHQRTDRDDYVTVSASQVQNNKDNYAADGDVHPFRYDSASIMHYPSGVGLCPGPRAWAKIGQRKQLSQMDKLFLNYIYPPVAEKNNYHPKLGKTGLWYCGRRVMEDNGFPFGRVRCNGYCGPNDGPNCPTCIMYGCTSHGEEYPKLKVGDYCTVAQSGETGLFYCGRVFKHRKTDGYCGPNNGLNCAHCHKVLQR